jgi:hypothetical protein
MAFDHSEMFVMAMVFIAGFFVINAMRGQAREVSVVLGMVVSLLAGEVVAVLLSRAAAPATGEEIAPPKSDLRLPSSYNG